ncbi:Pre-mrna-splicing factor clf1 [Thalictrum thalictroides]|uniref:Pre-mrna-splicing factor clf1 n=1 Tax=Thalictrum thalictroides TaxID=46969 RepID=A0A7J6V5B6_THATH|nr:Pre-mrna-splicing factor clf1 [Thalictrum thalictroides]
MDCPATPDQQGWRSYVKFEARCTEIERARQVFERFVQCCPEVGSWVLYAKFEVKNKELNRARYCFERAVEAISVVDDEVEVMFLAFAEFEEQCKEIERARCIYKFALDGLPKGQTEGVYKNFLKFEKQNGDTKSIEDTLVDGKRLQYEEQVRKNPLNYDAWFDYIHLEMEVNADDKERIRGVYEKAISNFEIRQKNLEGARKLLGNSIGRAAKHKIFRKYIELELMLGNFNRCRTLYEKYLEWAPEISYAWSKYVELEISSNDMERARALFQLVVAQHALDVPELLWKNYIDFELSLNEYEKRGKSRTNYLSAHYTRRS